MDRDHIGSIKLWSSHTEGRLGAQEALNHVTLFLGHLPGARLSQTLRT